MVVAVREGSREDDVSMTTGQSLHDGLSRKESVKSLVFRKCLGATA